MNSATTGYYDISKLYATSKENNTKLLPHACSKLYKSKPLYFNTG
jgi:hypothetical protein